VSNMRLSHESFRTNPSRVRATAGKSLMAHYWTLGNRPVDVTATEPSVVFVVKSLLAPVIVVLTLIASLFIWDVPLAGPYIIAAVLAFIGTAHFIENGQIHVARTLFSELRSLIDLALRWCFVLVFICALLHISNLSGHLNRAALLTWGILTPLVLWLSHVLIFNFGLRHVPHRRAVVVGLTEHGLQLESKLREDPLLCTDVMGFFDDRSPARLPVACHQRILGGAAQLSEYVRRNGINVVYITLPMNRDPRIMGLLDELKDSTASIYFVPDIFVFNLIQARFDLINGIPVVAVRESPFYGVHGVMKRLSDVTIAALCIVLLSPLLLLIAAGVRLSSKGQVIFKQKRYGLDGYPIIIYKFRSMTVVEDGETIYTQVSRNDVRVSRFGAFLRRTSLDELPQLFNVLEGSMSLVGPRPHAVAVNEQYRRLIPRYMVRHKVKPGITGWAQINGCRGGDDLETMTKRIAFDLEYLCNWSLGLDIVIILKTANLVWRDRRAY
jgi:putative colanic acid biosysnthesis UDP-glucose lipid carrier transferase